MIKKLLSSYVFLILVALSTSLLSGEPFAWQKDYAKVLPTGGLQWAPEPYTFAPEGEIRYIDYENGSDTNEGTKRSPWKHHPWDANARGNARVGDADTYVFKGGVTYRGSLEVPHGASGKLLRDPTWGAGEARFYGSETVTGWRKAAHKDMPEGGKVWAAEVDFLPRNAWVVRADGSITRLKLARTPNWEMSDPDNVNAEWWEWENPNWWERYTKGKDPMVMQVNGKKMHKGVSAKLASVAEHVEGATIWSEAGLPTMDIPMPMRALKYVPEENAVSLGTPWYDGYAGMIVYKTGHRFYLEDKPAFLDEAGEFWVEKTGNSAATIYARLPGDQSPDRFTVEAARYSHFIEAPTVGDLTIAGLTFRFGNAPWNYTQAHFLSPDLPAAVIRTLGSAESLNIHHNVFEHVNIALYAIPEESDGFGFIAFNDNKIAHTDLGVVKIDDDTGTTVSRNPEKRSELEKHAGIHSVETLRNYMYMTGFRTTRGLYQYGITVGPADLIHIAGNIGHRMARQTIDVYGAKKSGDPRYAPFTRILIHQNESVDAMLQSSDWAGIENWQGGPAYVFNNVSGNPGGIMNWSAAQRAKEKKGTPRFAFAYYTDGAQKTYHFNNIAWGKNNTPGSIYANNSGFQSLIGFQNSKVNNTVYKFVNGIRRQGTGGSRMHEYLGNLFEDISEYVFLHHTGKTDPNFSHFNNQEGYDFRLMSYADNVFTKPGIGVGIIDESGAVYESVEEMAERLKEYSAAAWEVGTEAESSLLRDPENKDFRPTSAATAQPPAKAFIPWSLYATVGEWNFIPNRDDPSLILDEHWNMSEALISREQYQYGPRYDLQGDWVTINHFVESPFETWAASALRFEGKPLVLTDEAINRTVTVKTNNKKGPPEKTFPEGYLPTVEMDNNNFIVEILFHADNAHLATLVAKKGTTGYSLTLNEQGKIVGSLHATGGATVTSSTATIANAWTHALLEADRDKGKLRLYINGKLSAEESIDLGKTSLENDADFIVGNGFQGTLAFLRVSRGSLADAFTTIEELYAWQFEGPMLRDFAGKPRNFKAGAAGALEL